MCEQDTIALGDVDAEGSNCLYFMCAGEEELNCGWDSDWIAPLYDAMEGSPTVGFAEFQHYVFLHQSIDDQTSKA